MQNHPGDDVWQAQKTPRGYVQEPLVHSTPGPPQSTVQLDLFAGGCDGQRGVTMHTDMRSSNRPPLHVAKVLPQLVGWSP